ncbi:MAG TPA: FAD-dependent monooxygenase [Prolixibacteraceae bacterium]|nr:FAD-dependent monooxygenase [Prolixibacteraceae bacterium]
MKKELNIAVLPVEAGEQERLKSVVSGALKVDKDRIFQIVVVRHSIDARNSRIRINLSLEVYIDEKPEKISKPSFDYPFVGNKKPVVIVGAGPAGLFAALHLIELGFRPVILERGKQVSERKKDIAAIHGEHHINPDSNYGYGEGGAGTFSDGKLYTRSKKRGDVRKVLEVLNFHGAQDEILVEAHPHIGTNVLPKVIGSIRETIERSGGSYHFNSRVTDLIIDDDRIKGVVLQNGDRVEGIAVILATGHSARDIYYLLQKRQIELEAKSFALGVRIEHPQELIDKIQYHGINRGKYLPPAAYAMVEQVGDRGVYSFCMCPGGMVVPAATAPGELVVNGMSPSHRGGKFANSGMVTEIRPEDIPKEFQRFGLFAGLEFQQAVERNCFRAAGASQLAPAKRLSDFVYNHKSSSLPDTSYRPGLIQSDICDWLPDFITARLREGLIKMGRKSNGYITNEAIVLGAETRTSSPLRIPRSDETLEHLQIKGLFPCGEGSGYAGGIVSSAVDGERVAEMIGKIYK